LGDFGTNFPYGQSYYKDEEGAVTEDKRHELAMRKLSPLDKLKGDSIFVENFEVSGHYLDLCEDSGAYLLDELFPDTTQSDTILSWFETTYNLTVELGDSIETRQNRIIAAMRARGGLSKQYFEDLGNKLGDGDYTVSIAEGSGTIGFIVATYSKNTIPTGAATVLPGAIYSAPFGQSCYLITVTVTGTAAAPDLERLYARLKPAWTKFVYVYIP